MEDSLTNEPQPTSACANCGLPAIQSDHPTPLCDSCRQGFIAAPIPHWIRAFAGGVCIILLFSLYTFPSNLSMGIHLERGKRAEKERNFLTAEKELQDVTKKMPDNPEANGLALIAAFYNQDFDQYNELLGKVSNRNIENDDLLGQLNFVVDKASIYVDTDSFASFSAAHPNLAATPDSSWKNYLSRYPSDAGAMLSYASQLFDNNRYALCDSVVDAILAVHSDFLPALMMGASVKRQLGKNEDALRYDKAVLAINHQSLRGLGSEVRTLLRLKRDAEALAVGLQAYRLNNSNAYVKASLILAYHFNGKQNDRDALIKTAMKEATDSSDKEAVQYALDVIAKKEKFRD